MASKITRIYKNCRGVIFYLFGIRKRKSIPELDTRNHIDYLNDKNFKDLFVRASAIEPQISVDYFSKGLVTNEYRIPKANASVILEEIYQSINTKPDYIFLLPWLKKGGAEWVACIHINFVLSKNYKVLIINTETNDLSAAPWITNGTPEIVSLSKYKKSLSNDDYLTLLLTLCIQLKPKVIHNINSHHCWQLINKYSKQLSINSKICTVA